MEFVAIQKFLISSPRKLREVAFMIKGLTPEGAVERLPFTGKRASEQLRKVILTAIANAKQKDVNPSDLVFKEIQINEGPRLKRYRAGARGRAKPYKKRMSHIRIVLVVKEKEAVAGKEEVSKKETKREKLVEAKKANRKQEAEKKV
jgi:large subunit ribosomal protein L22